ncbi:MAG: hypothetical protein ABWZ25_02160 [Chitinophagaceae bacterium]
MLTRNFPTGLNQSTLSRNRNHIRLIITGLAVFLFTAGLSAQDRFTAAIRKGITMMDSTASSAANQETANYFERIANAEPGQWLAQYYTGLTLIYVGYDESKDRETRDLIFDKAMEFADKADKLHPQNSDIYALKGYILFMKMAVAPQSRAMTMIPASNTLLEKAIALDPANPRGYLLKGQNLFYTPEAFGGGKEKAAVLLKQAAVIFETQNNNGIEPSWGKRRCQSLLDKIN